MHVPLVLFWNDSFIISRGIQIRHFFAAKISHLESNKKKRTYSSSKMRGLRTSYIFCLQAKTKMKSISWKTKTLELTEWRKRSTFLFFLVFNFLMVKMKLKTNFTRFILNFSHFLAMWQKFTYKLQTESKQTKTQKWTPSPGRTGPLRGDLSRNFFFQVFQHSVYIFQNNQV